MSVLLKAVIALVGSLVLGLLFYAMSWAVRDNRVVLFIITVITAISVYGIIRQLLDLISP